MLFTHIIFLRIFPSNKTRGLPYYHYGFHYIILSLRYITSIQITKIILIFGQFLQILAPITIFYPVYSITKNFSSALLSVFVSGLVWNLPSQASSWGKYPALLAIVTIVFIFYTLHSLIFYPNKKFVQTVFQVAALIVAILIHSRLLIVMIIWISTEFLFCFCKNKLYLKENNISFLLINYSLIGVLVLLGMIGRINNWTLSFSSYSVPLLVLITVLLPFSFSYYFDFTFKMELLIFLFLLFSIIPFPKAIDFFAANTLIDCPFLSIFLFIPFSIILGTGFAGFDQFVRKRERVEGEVSSLLSVQTRQERLKIHRNFPHFDLFLQENNIKFFYKFGGNFGVLFLFTLSFIFFPIKKYSNLCKAST